MSGTAENIPSDEYFNLSPETIKINNQNSKEMKVFNIENESLQDRLISFNKIIEKEINNTDNECEKQKNIIDKAVTKYIASLHKQQETIKDEIELFYADKKSNLKRALSDTQRLEDFNRNSQNPIVQRNLKKMAKELMYATENIINKMKYFELKENYKYENNIGKLKTPIYEKPIKEHIILLNSQLKKVIATKKGFLAWQSNNKIIELNYGHTVVSEKNDILDICSTFDNRLSYIVYVDSKFYCKTLNLENDEWIMRSFSYPFNNLSSIMFGVYKKNIIISSDNGKTHFYHRTNLEVSEIEDKTSKKKPISHKAFKKGLCIDFGDELEYFSDFNADKIFLNIKTSTIQDFSLYDNIIDKLIEGEQIFCSEKDFVLFNVKSGEGYLIEHEKIFPGKRLLEYQLTNSHIVFCLLDIENPKMITIQYYPVLKDENF
ncbi:unnamed protein product [Dimorphilus gyrociliatus]|uniref:Uncharacterized protein n=1 Tax=Dimorphilus gyrociliatus TaxID=2664684 RepID=A0A7I8VF40_9ANNE|nr:unnamed protein product [Dimorphilus gyrociliatus]